MLNRKKRALRSQTTGLGRIGRVLLSVLVLLTFAALEKPAYATDITNNSSYGPANAGTFTVPANVTTIYFVVKGAAGGTGGTDGADSTHSSSGAVGYVTGTYTVSSGDTIGIYPGYKGSDGPTGGGTSYNSTYCPSPGTLGETNGGNSTVPAGGYNGGQGGRPGCSGSSGAGGGGGAASVLKINSTTIAVAGGGGGGGGGCNASSSCYDNGQDAANASGRPGTTGTTQNSPYSTGGSAATDSNGANAWYLTYDKCYANGTQTADGGSGGGGGGGAQGGGSGGFYDARNYTGKNGNTNECGGFGGYRGSNSSSLTGGSNTTTTSTTDGSITVYFITSSASSASVTTTYGIATSDTVTSTSSASLSSATLDSTPSGISLNTTSLGSVILNISATAGSSGSTTTYNLTVTITDSNGAVSKVPIGITINKSISGLTYSTLTTDVGVAQSESSTAVSGGTGTYTYSISVIPGGATSGRVSVNSSNGTLTINTNAQTADAGTYTIKVTDAVGSYLTTTVSILINPALAGTADSNTATAAYGNTISDAVRATAGTGTGAVSFSMSPSISGITLDSSTASSRYATVNISVINVGTYYETVTITDSLSTTFLKPITISITTRQITVKANSAAKVYGTVNPNLNGFTISSGSMYSTDTFTITGSTSANQSSNAGSYSITPASASFSTGSASNYTITYQADTLTVSRIQLTVKANSISRIYGDVNPSLNGYTITSGSTYSTDTFTVTGSTTATQGSSVGIYPISQTLNSFSSGSSSNYTLTFVGDTLTVGARPATVKANSVSRKYGAANPSLTGFTISSGSIYSTDTFTVNGSTTATTSSNIGTYPITQSLNTFTTGSASNYNLTFQADTLTVSQADTLTITASTLADVTYKLSASGVIPSFSTSGLVGGDTLTISTSTGYFYQGYASPTCAQGGYCNLGDVGPAGGIVFYDFGAGSGESSSTPVSTGGRYLEAAPAGSGGYPTGVSTTAVWCSGSTGAFSQDNIVGLGAGANATNVVVHGTNHCTGGAAYLADGYSANTYNDWFLPTIIEGQYMLNYWSQIGMQSGINYWTSSNRSGDTNQTFYLKPPTYDGNATEVRTTSERWWPIRAFDPTNTTPTLTGTPTKTLPTLTGTYQITIDSTTPTFTAGSASNYVAISYAAGSVKIVKTNYKFLSANESVTVMTYPYGTSLQLVAASDAGDTTTATFSVTNGANSTCTTSSVTTNSLILSATATGTNNAICLVTLTRAATTNFNAITGATTTITFIRFTPVAAVPYFSGGGNVAVGIGDPTTYVASDTASVISAIYDNTTSSSSVFHAGDSITLTGTYLDGVTQIKFIGGGTTVTFSANSSPTTLTFTLPGDVVSGPVLVQKPALDGRGYKSGRFNITIT